MHRNDTWMCILAAQMLRKYRNALSTIHGEDDSANLRGMCLSRCSDQEVSLHSTLLRVLEVLLRETESSNIRCDRTEQHHPSSFCDPDCVRSFSLQLLHCNRDCVLVPAAAKTRRLCVYALSILCFLAWNT